MILKGLCQHQRRQKSDGTPGTRCLAYLDEQGQHAQECLNGGDRAKLHDVGCHIIHNACCEAGQKSQREVVVPMLATEKPSEPQVDVDAWWHPGLPHIRLDYTIFDAEALHYSSAMRKAQEEAPAAAQAERNKANKYGHAKGGIGVTGISMQLTGRFGPGFDTLFRRLAGYKRAISKALGRECGRPLQDWRKLLSLALARYIAATILSATGHKALRGMWCALALSFSNPFGTEPLLVNTASKTETETDWKTKGGIGVMGIAVQLSGRFGPGLDRLLRKLAERKRAITKAVGKDSGRRLEERRKLLSAALARYTTAIILSATGHQALRGK